MCDFIAKITNNRLNYLKIMRYTRQNPARVEDEGEYEAVFKNAKKTFIDNGYYHLKATVTKRNKSSTLIFNFNHNSIS